MKIYYWTLACFLVFVTKVGATTNNETGPLSLKRGQTPFTENENSVRPRKIVSINLCTDELLLQLVGPSRVAALTKFSTDPEVSTVALQAKDIRQIQGDIEHVLACEPDMVLSGRFSNRETVRFFERSGIPVLVFKVPKSFENIYADIRRMAEAVGENGKAEAIIKEMQDELARLKNTSRPRRAVFFQSDHYVPGAGTFENAVMEAAGLRNIAVELGIKDYGRMGLEELIRARPDVIIFSGEQKKAKTVRGEVLGHPAIQKALPAVKTVTLPTLYLNCGSPASVEAVRILVKETQ
jgi:iron complex transport system substrate-binding protein